MDLSWCVFDLHPQIVYQFSALPFALLFYFFTKLKCLSVISRYIYLLLGGCVLATVTMGQYCLIVLTPAATFVLLLLSVHPQHVHFWGFFVQMCWQTLWHLLIQYKEHWLQESIDNRLLVAISSLMLLTQRVTSLSMDIQEGKLQSLQTKAQSSVRYNFPLWIPYLSYTLFFPALLGGPLCSFSYFRSFVEQNGLSSIPFPLGAVLQKTLLVLSLEGAKTFLRCHLSSNSLSQAHFNVLEGILFIWGISLLYKLSYYSHWTLSESLNNAAGLGFRGYNKHGNPLWDALSDGNILTLETLTRLSHFARMWNKTTAEWLRRLVFQKCHVSPLLLTFGFSAWWHGLHPGQLVGFLCWAATVEADYRIHHYLSPYMDSKVKRLIYKVLTWFQTQLVIACIVVIIELRYLSSVWLLFKAYIGLFPLLNCLVLVVLPRKQQIKVLY
ncbi:ghrelin O-acyltransferase [Lepisosteus oculatus]|uniref:Ghrelin O-acyltransferase n=1 Tax=Lepisosteus oculatus TaxID=7918 RepID=A0A1S7UE62_LEPOC|nr:TPA_inf: ghrelin O-acyltransferase [Lepisosteus oculatus]